GAGDAGPDVAHGAGPRPTGGALGAGDAAPETGHPGAPCPPVTARHVLASGPRHRPPPLQAMAIVLEQAPTAPRPRVGHRRPGPQRLRRPRDTPVPTRPAAPVRPLTRPTPMLPSGRGRHRVSAAASTAAVEHPSVVDRAWCTGPYCTSAFVAGD